MNQGVEFDYTPCSTGLFPDLRPSLPPEWETAIQSGNIIKISARAEYTARTGKDEPPLDEQIGWREYFAWLADCSEDTPWLEMKTKMVERLAKLFGFQIHPAPVEELGQEARKQSRHLELEAAKDNIAVASHVTAEHETNSGKVSKRETLADVIRLCVPAPDRFGRSFEQMYIEN